MTPQERDLIAQLLERLRHAQGTKDPEADAMIRQALAAQPDAPYYLVQTVLIQDMALSQAQNRIAEIERKLAETPSQPTSFLGGLLGGGRGTAPAQPAGGAGPWGGRPAPGPGQPQAGQPQAGPWGQPQPPQQGYAAQQPMPMQPMMPQGASGGFLRQAAATAAGVAGGALLFQGIQSMFGGHAAGLMNQAGMQPGISETVTNNYYGGSEPDASGGDAPLQTASDDQGGGQDQDYAAADDYSGQDFASNDDFGGGDDLV